MLLTMDVECLYTNTDNTAGLAAVKQVFSNVDRQANLRIIRHIHEIQRSSIQFGILPSDTWYGNGENNAPNYTNIFMAEWEKKALRKCTKLPLIYLRYLDDIFSIWRHGEVEFLNFLNTLNNHQRCIQLTSIFKGDHFRNTGRFYSKVFFKLTDTHQLLHKDTFHPKHTFFGHT